MVATLTCLGMSLRQPVRQVVESPALNIHIIIFLDIDMYLYRIGDHLRIAARRRWGWYDLFIEMDDTLDPAS